MTRSAHHAIVALFLSVIALPLGANLSGMDGGEAGAESRDLAPFPALNWSWGAMRELPAGLDRWFDDHFGFRAKLVRWQAMARYYGLEMSASPTVIRGDEGWLYYAEDGALEDIAGARPLNDGELREWRESISRARDWLRKSETAYVFTVAPDKHLMYGEHLPRTLRRVGADSRIDQVLRTLSLTGVSLDLRPPLNQAKARERIYQRLDTHWNTLGAFAAYTAIIGAVRAQAPAVPPAWDRSAFVATSRRVYDGTDRLVVCCDLARMMGLRRDLSEENLELQPLRPRRAVVVEPPDTPPTAQIGRLVTEIPDSTLPRAVILRDSFAAALAPFLSEHFSRAVYLWQNDFDATVIEQERADVVIQEIVSRHLYDFVPSPDLVPR